MNKPLLKELRKQASFFLKEKIKNARLALTDVTPAQLLLRFEKKDWRASYNSLIVLEHLLTHGPESVAVEFQSDKHVINQMKSFQYIDDRGFNWGLTLQKKSERILKLLGEGHLLKGERERARKLSRGIQGFGSFSERLAPTHGIVRETSLSSSTPWIGRCNSDFNNHLNEVPAKFETNNSGMLQNSEPSMKEREEEFDAMINGGKEYCRLNMLIMEEQEYDHPFYSTDMHVNSSLLSRATQM